MQHENIGPSEAERAALLRVAEAEGEAEPCSSRAPGAKAARVRGQRAQGDATGETWN
jgi:hypothetical protein